MEMQRPKEHSKKSMEYSDIRSVMISIDIFYE